MTKTLSIVVPVYNEELVVKEFHNRLSSALSDVNINYDIIFVDDGSTDSTLNILKKLKEANNNVKILKFSKNFGHQIAITAGIDYAEGDAVIIIDSDLQDPPELIPELIDKWQQGFDVVYAQRKKRAGETFFKTITASLFYRFLAKASDTNIPPDTGDFRLISKTVADHLKSLKEKHRFVRGMIAWIGFKQTAVKYNRDERYAGKTKYPFLKMLTFSFDGISSFSLLPLKLATWLGFISSAFSFIYIIYVLYQKYIVNNVVQGWSSIMVAIFFLGGVQLISIGILGEYIGRIYDESKNRPLYIIDKIL